MVIKIQEQEIKLRYTLRGYMIFEQITEHSFNGKGMSDFITLFYSMVMASNKDITITFDEFLDWLDLNPESLSEFSNWITDNIRKQNELSPKKEEVKEETSDNSKN